MSDEPPCCSFCFNQDIPLFEGGVLDSTTRICAFCATRALAEITPQPVPEPAPPPERPSKDARLASIPSPKTLVAHLDQYVIGQDIAKRRLALGVSNHYKRLVDAWDRDAPDPIIADPDLHNVRIEKSNILLIGPSGSGKTHLVKSLASYLNVPLVIGDATSLTEAGYVGEDVESLLSKLIVAAEGDMETAQRGIVYIDEIDKIQRSGSGFKDMRLGVQHALLKMLEGTIATVPPAGGYKHPQQPGIPFDTTNVLFICGGAFVGLEDIIAKRLGRGGFGFSQMSENRQVDADGLLRYVKPEDLEAFGLIPEIIGRLPVIAPLDALGVDDLARILQTPKNSETVATLPGDLSLIPIAEALKSATSRTGGKSNVIARGPEPCSPGISRARSRIGPGYLATVSKFVGSGVQKAGSVPGCGPDVHRCGDQGNRQDRPGPWNGSQGASIGGRGGLGGGSVRP
jgi:ATP-dependent Clp protease ATP-binding subunit ClpX